MCLRHQRLRWHSDCIVNDYLHGVSVVNDYTDTMSKHKVSQNRWVKSGSCMERI